MITPLRNLVYITPIGDPDVSEGGIIIPDVAKRRSRQGIIKYAGPKCEQLRIGDYVLFSPYNGTVVQLEGENNMILMPEDKVELIIDNVGGLVIDGLYFKEVLGQSDLGQRFGYTPAPFELVIEMIANSLKDNKLYNNLWKTKDQLIHRPNVKEYDE